jgi:hypothetical protein
LQGQYQITTECLSCNDGSPHGPYLQPPNYPASPFTIYVPNVDGPNAKAGACEVTGNADFALQWGQSSSGGQQLYAQVTVQTGNMITDDPAKRAALKQSFTELRKALDGLEADQCLVPGGANVLANRVASALVLRLDEILFYYFGFDPVAGVELAPGMSLLLEPGAFQNVAPYGSGLPGAQLDAFVGAGQVEYLVSLNQRDQTLSFNPYLGSLAPYTVSPADSPLGSIVDLAAAGMARRYWRLVYPAQFSGSTSITQDPALKYNVALLGADSLADLQSAVTAYTGPSPSCPDATGGNQPILCLYFAGRAAIVPQIPIIFQGSPLLVPLGTTLRDLFDRFMVQTPADINSFLFASSFNAYRYGLLVLGPPPGSGLTAAKLPIVWDTHASLAPVPDTGLTIYDLPFVLRDTIAWNW